MGPVEFVTTNTEDIEDRAANRLALIECLESCQERLEGAISTCYGLTGDEVMDANFVGKIQAAWLILRDVEKSVRSL